MVDLYRNSPVWKKAYALGGIALTVTSFFPKDRDRELAAQIRDAVQTVIGSLERGMTEEYFREYIACLKGSYCAAVDLRQAFRVSRLLGYVGVSSHRQIEDAVESYLRSLLNYIRLTQFMDASFHHERAYNARLLRW